MKLLIVTQKVDRNDPILGFFHRWLEEFALDGDEITVIAQCVGEYDLPKVKVHSLRKELGASRIFQIVRFWFLSWKLRRQYDAVFIHMTPIWVILGWKVWLLLRKRVYLWYEVRRGGLILRIAVACVRRVFSATSDGLPFKSRKNLVIGHGIDTELFSPGKGERDQHLLFSAGRVTGIKRFDALLQCLAALPAPYRLLIAGGPLRKEDNATLAQLRVFVKEHALEDRVEMHFMPQEQIRDVLRACRLFIHACGGGLDKALLEAMACEAPIVSAAEAAIHVLPEQCLATLSTMTEMVQRELRDNVQEKEKIGPMLRRRVLESHSLPRLVQWLRQEMSKKRR